jgi:uncharacterized protein
MARPRDVELRGRTQSFESIRSTWYGAGLIRGANIPQPCRVSVLPHQAARLPPVPFHADFDEVNLRFYVRRKEGNTDRRGVVFIAEVVPRRAIATTARLAYGENYMRLPMRHRIETQGLNKAVEYLWQVGDQWCRLYAQIVGLAAQPQEGSLEQFITEHFWGYSTQRAGGCVEYHVSHVPWQVWQSSKAGFEGKTSALYGNELATVLQRRPDSAFVADGSPVIVFTGNRIQ